MKSLTARDAKNGLGAALDAAQREAVLITRHGRRVAALVSIEELALIPRYRKLAVEDRQPEAMDAEAIADRQKRALSWLGALRGTFGTVEEIDANLREQRDSWDR